MRRKKDLICYFLFLLKFASFEILSTVSRLSNCGAVPEHTLVRRDVFVFTVHIRNVLLNEKLQGRSEEQAESRHY